MRKVKTVFRINYMIFHLNSWMSGRLTATFAISHTVKTWNGEQEISMEQSCDVSEGHVPQKECKKYSKHSQKNQIKSLFWCKNA